MSGGTSRAHVSVTKTVTRTRTRGRTKTRSSSGQKRCPVCGKYMGKNHG